MDKSVNFDTKSFAKAIGHTERSLFGIYNKEDISTALLKTVLKKLNVSYSDFFGDEIKNEVAEPTVKYRSKGNLVERQRNLLKELNTVTIELTNVTEEINQQKK